MAISGKGKVLLTPGQRETLGKLVRTGTQSALTRLRAQILLKADRNGAEAWSDKRIAEALDISYMTVSRVRHQFASHGMEATLHRKKPTGRQYRKLDGAQEAQLITLACSSAPEGHARWTMVLLADKLVEMKVVESIDPATVWRTLKKTT